MTTLPRRALLAQLVLLMVGCAPLAAYRGVRPAPGTVMSWESGVRPASDPWVVNTADPAQHHLGTLRVGSSQESLVVLIYGDNRPGDRMLTTSWGANAVKSGFADSSPLGWLWGVVNVPVALIQSVVPRLDGMQDLLSRTVTHRFTGGAEKQVLAALEAASPADLVINTGDLVQDGRRGRQWEDFADRHRSLRERVPYVAAVGNHEQTWAAIGRENWNAVMGSPPAEGRYWYSLDLPDGLARIVVLDTNLLADAKDHYPDSLQLRLCREQLDWADAALQARSAAKIVVVHHPLVSCGRHLGDWEADDRRPPEERQRARLLEILAARGVTAVFSGHEHLYQKGFVSRPGKPGFWHLTTGGGGSPLYRLTGRARARARAKELPDDWTVQWPGQEQSVYHYGRLVLTHNENGEPSARLDVHRVWKNGKVRRIDRLDLMPAPEAR